jgi:hypothetical protein
MTQQPNKLMMPRRKTRRATVTKRKKTRTMTTTNMMRLITTGVLTLTTTTLHGANMAISGDESIEPNNIGSLAAVGSLLSNTCR